MNFLMFQICNLITRRTSTTSSLPYLSHSAGPVLVTGTGPSRVFNTSIHGGCGGYRQGPAADGKSLTRNGVSRCNFPVFVSIASVTADRVLTDEELQLTSHWLRRLCSRITHLECGNTYRRFQCSGL